MGKKMYFVEEEDDILYLPLKQDRERVERTSITRARPISNNPYMSTPYKIDQSNEIKKGAQTKYNAPIISTNQSNTLNPNNISMNDIYDRNSDLEWYDKQNQGKKKTKGNDAGLGLLKSALSLGNYVGQGVLKAGETALDTALQIGTSKWNPYYIFNPDELESHQQIAKEIIEENAVENLVNTLSGDENFNKNFLDKGSLIKSDNLGGQIAHGIGNMLPSILIGNTGAGNIGSTISLGVNAYGGGLEEAYNDGANRKQANLYGLGSAGLEMATEWITGGIPGVKSLEKIGLDSITEKGLKKISNQVTKEVLRAGYKMVGEGLEEGLSEYFNSYLKEFIYTGNKGDSIGQKIVNAHNKADWNAVMQSALSGAITGGILEAPMNMYNIRNGLTKQTQINSNNNQIVNLQNQQNASVSNQRNNIINEQIFNLEQQNAILSGNEPVNPKIVNFQESAKQYFDDSVKSRNFQKIAEKLISEKNYNIVLDDTLNNGTGNFVNAQINTLENGETEIRINPNSPKAGEFLLVHEITHNIETDSMKNLILDYASKHDDFSQSLESLKKTYNTNDISSEVIADISGELFGNQEFINNLSIEQPNIFKRLYNKIVELANRLTGNAHEALFVRDLKQKWEKAYRENNNQLNNAKFSEIYNNDGTVNRIKINENIFENNNGKSINQTIKEYLENHIGDVYTIIESGQKIYLGKDLPGEYTYSKSAQSLPKTKKLAKGRAVTNLREIVENATNRKWQSNNKEKHNIDSKYGFYRYDTTFSFDYNGKEKIYNGTVLIRNDDNRKKYLYDILNIQPQKKLANLPSVASNSEMSSAMIDGSSNQSNDNIPQSNSNVKSGTLPKYSMQENINDTDSSGRKLSKQQQEYFKNSKIRDEKGNLKIMYHGTSNDFTVFDNKKSNFNNLMFFSESPVFSLEYSLGTRGKYDHEGEYYINGKMLNYDWEDNLIKPKNEYLEKTDWDRNIYPVYLNVEKLFDGFKNETEKLNFENYLKEKYGMEGYALENFIEEVDSKNEFDAKEDEKFILWAHNNGYDGIAVYESDDNNQRNIAVFNSNQIKSINNLNPSKSEDIRFSKNNKSWQQYLDNYYKNDGTKTYFKDIKKSNIGDNILPKSSQSTEVQKEQLNANNKAKKNNKEASKVNYSKDLSDIINNNSQNVEDYISQQMPDLKLRKWAETSTESQVVNNEVKLEELDVRKITYEIKSNKSSLEKANRVLATNGYENSIKQFNAEYESNKLPRAEDIILGERLIQETLKQKNYELAGDLIEKVSILGTELGQATQALSLIQRLTPEGQLGMLQKTVNRMKKKNIKGIEQLNVTQEMVEEILSVRKDDGSFDMNELDNAVEKVKQKLGQQLPSTVMDKINGWRYLSMLGNPKTHIRNIVSNVAMKATLSYKNILASAIEDISSKGLSERTKTLKWTTSEIHEFAKQDAIDMRNVITGDDKYSMSSQIEKEKQIFKTKWLEKISNLNSDLLEIEDWLFSRKAYEKAFEKYLTANGIKTKKDIENNNSVVEKGRLYAIEEAKKATFRQESKIASKINAIEKVNKGTEFLVGAVLPYKKTPINIAKTGVNYSPVGLAKSLTVDVYNLKNGNITANQFIDNISQGLSGSSLVLLGGFLSQLGVLNGSGGDDKEDKYDSQLGKQAYSINIMGHTYTLDWLSPSAIPLFTGVELQRILEDQNGINGNVIMDSVTQILDPMSSMSVLQGINNTLNSYSKNKIQGIIEESTKSYIGQFFPTLGGQVAKTIDPIQRSTAASKNSSFKFGEEIVRSNMAKIPGASYLLEPATDVWGNTKKRGNLLSRTVENFISPGYLKKTVETDIDKELKSLYSKNGNKGVLPGNYYANLTYQEKNYKMSAKEFTKYKKQYGNTAYKVISDIVKSDSYKMSEVKENMIEDAYTYARELAKKDYFKSKGIEYESKNQKWVQEIENKISPDKYISFKKNDIDLIKGDKDDKGNTIKGTSTGKKAYKIVNNNLLNDSEKDFLLSDITTSENPVSLLTLKKLKNNEDVFKYYYGLSKKDTFDNIVINGNVNQEVYIDVKRYVSDLQKNYINSEERKRLIFQYIQDKNISKNQKIMLYGMSGYGISDYKNDMFQYINSLNLSKSEKEEIYYYLYPKKGSD